ncbi:hypothetical protein AAC387_Pa07g1925 [Persea americana]
MYWQSNGDYLAVKVECYAKIKKSTYPGFELFCIKERGIPIEFYNLDELDTMATEEHFMTTSIEWDPTGRYVVTSVTSVHEMGNVFNVWTFDSRVLYRISRDRFYHRTCYLDLDI